MDVFKKVLTTTSFLVAAYSFAGNSIIFEENIDTTLSLNGGQLGDVLTCDPGDRGAYPTPDVLTLSGTTISTGLATDVGHYIAYSDLGLQKDPPHSSLSPRPYAEGCQLAIDKIKADLLNKDIVELTIKRSVQNWGETASLIRKNLKGDILSYKTRGIDTIVEFLDISISGFDFYTNHSVNLQADPF